MDVALEAAQRNGERWTTTRHLLHLASQRGSKVGERILSTVMADLQNGLDTPTSVEVFCLPWASSTGENMERSNDEEEEEEGEEKAEEKGEEAEAEEEKGGQEETLRKCEDGVKEEKVVEEETLEHRKPNFKADPAEGERKRRFENARTV